MSGGRIAVLVHVSGLVQGVWFRAWTEERALELGLSGWVRNRRDGRVEALFAGPGDAVDRMIEACWTGPPHARVDAVESRAVEDPGAVGFEQRASVRE